MLSRLTRSVAPRLRTFCTKSPPPTSGGRRPTEAEVISLAESARNQQQMWNTFVPEGGIKFGDKCVPTPRVVARDSRARR